MSGVVKGVKKVFKKVAKVIKKIIKPVAIAVAAYFTAGIALSFIPATSAFAASLPGFAGGGFLGTGIGAGAAGAGTGIFSTAASAIGLGGGLASGAAKVTGAAMAAGAQGGALLAGGADAGGVLAGSLATGAAPETAAALGTTFGAGGGATVGGSSLALTGPGSTNALLAGTAGMSLTDKLLMAKVGTDVAGALFGPSPEEDYAAQAEEAAKFRGAFYGMNADGTGAIPAGPPAIEAPQQSAPQQAQQAQPAQLPAPTTAANQAPMGQVPQTQPQQIAPQAGQVRPGSAAPTAGQPGTQQLGAGLFPEEEQVAVAQPTGNLGQMQTQINAPSSLFAPTPGVRYV